MMIWLAMITKTAKWNGFIWSVHILQKFQKGDGFAQNVEKQENKKITVHEFVFDSLFNGLFFILAKYL